MENRVNVVDFLEQVIMLEEMMNVMGRFNYDGNEAVEALRVRLEEFNEQRSAFLEALADEKRVVLEGSDVTATARDGFASALATTLVQLLDNMSADMDAINSEGIVNE